MENAETSDGLATSDSAAGDQAPTDWPSVDLRVDRAHPARVYDVHLGGKDNFPADREVAARAVELYPDLPIAIRTTRAFLVRATRFLARDAGIRQFLDIGSGIPTSPNLHEVAQAVAPDARVIYADNDPIVLAYSRALLTSSPEGRTVYLDADLRNPAAILTAPQLRETFDLTRPVGLSLLAVLHFVPDDADAYQIVAELLAALAPGSYLALTHATADQNPAAGRAAAIYRDRGITMTMRTRDQIARFFGGLQFVEPGLVAIQRWRPDPDDPAVTDAQVSGYAAVVRKG
jgi:S-adenosyl methyltransferase